MKKILLIFALLPLWVFPQQVADTAMATYADTYINTNNVGSITGAQMNQMLNYLISSKVNHDSATTVRVSVGLDTLFVTYWGYPEDTVPVSSDSTIWGSNGSTKIYTKEATDYVGIGTDDPMTRLHIVDSTGSLGINPYLYTTTAGNYPQLNFGKFNGTPSNYNAIANSTIIGGVNFNASYNTSATASAAGIIVSSTQLWSATERGNQMLFYTVQNDSAARDVSMRIDSNANVMVPMGDVVTFGGYSTWVPTWAWTGGNIGTPTTVVARYMVINRTVFFHIDAEGTNESGSTSTAFNITLPETVKDVNSYRPCVAYYNSAAKAMPTTAFIALIDADVNLKLYGISISIANNDDFKIVIDGKYEIRGK